MIKYIFKTLFHIFNILIIMMKSKNLIYERKTL